MKSGMLLAVVLGTSLLGGCAVIPPEELASDPLEPVNRVVDKFNDKVDRFVFKPLAQGYQKVVPSPVRTGVNNVFANLNDPAIAVNNILQGKVHDGVSDGVRFVFNSTFGVLGIFDVASHLGHPKHDEDFGQTLATWGVGEGWYLVLPFTGPSNVRDAFGRIPDNLMDPVLQHDETRERNALLLTRAIDTRANLLSASKVRDAAALDSYLFTREAYRQLRWNRVHDGNPPAYEFEFDDGMP